MPAFDRDLTDPTPDAVEAALCDAVKAANGKARVGLLAADRADYRRFLADEFLAPEGVGMWLADKGRVAAYPPTPRATLAGVVWRATPLGRSVRVVGRRIEPFQEHPSHRFGPPYRGVPPLCLLDPDHVVLRTFAGEPPEAVAVCACGAVGPPAKLAWEAEGRCGPCHDHFVDHGRPLADGVGPPVLRTKGQLRNVAFLDGGRKVAAYEWIPGYSSYHAQQLAAVWDRQTGACRCGEPVRQDKLVLSRDDFAAAALLTCDAPALLVPPEGAAAWLLAPSYGVATTAVGPTLVALSYGGEAHRRDLALDADWTECWPSRRGADELYYAIAVSPDGKRAALGREGCAVELVDWPGGGGSATLRPPADADRDGQRPHRLAFSPDGKLLAVGVGKSGFVEDPSREWFGWGGGLHLYDLSKGEFVASFERPTDDVLALAFSPGGEYLFWGATDCQIRAVDVRSRREVCVLSGHVGCVNDLTFSPDGQTLASAGGDGEVRLWPWRALIEKEKPPAAKKKRAK